MHTSNEKVKAIDSFHMPTNKADLSVFCGMVKYYHRFLPRVSEIMTPLFALIGQNSVWKWGECENKAFLKAKELLKSNNLLIHYDASTPLFLTCDASLYGLGAVLEQKDKDGLLRPVSYASRTMAKAEENYSQTEKVGLAVVWSVSKFHKYLFGRSFEIWSDHKPLLGLIGESKAVPRIASGRIIRWSLLLAGYNYKLCYKPGCRIPNADCLSRFPKQVDVADPPKVGEEILLLDQLSLTVVRADDIRRWTDHDPVLSCVRNNILRGWEECSSEEFRPYINRKDELTVLNGCVLWGNRVFIPPQDRESVINELHESHPGIVKMKSLARCYTWWPSMDKDLEMKGSACRKCQENRNFPMSKQPLHPWEFPSKLWSRLHIDYAGPIDGHMFLVVVDAFSKWLEVIQTNGCSLLMVYLILLLVIMLQDL